MPFVTSANNNVDDYQLKFALKNMLPIPSNSEQQILLDEYSAQISQFSIAINRIIREEFSDENCVHLLKLLAGMYTLLKTTLLSPPIYRDLFVGICRVEADACRFISNWSLAAADSKQEELFELGWWCESALPRAYLVTLLFSCLPALRKDPKYISATFSVCKSVQHPLKGSFLYARLHSFLLRIFFNDELSEEMKAVCSGYSIETFTVLLKYFCRWHLSLPTKTTEPAYVASLFHETFEGVCGQISRMTSFDMFEAVLLPTFLVEIVNCRDSLAQTLSFQAIINEFDDQYLYTQLSQLIRAASQFATGIDLKSLLDGLFRKVQGSQMSNEAVFFETIWEETSLLIKNRCEIDQCDTVIISSLVLTLISRTNQQQQQQKIGFIEKVLEFLIKMLKTIRPDGFNSETCPIGKEIVELIRGLADEFDFNFVLLKLASLPELLNCLKPASARKCCSTILLPKLRGNLGNSDSFSNVMRLFSCFTQRDLIELLDDGGEEALKLVSNDLREFSLELINCVPVERLEEFHDAINSPGSCLNLFLIPEMLELSLEASLCKKLILSFLYNTSTVLPQRLSSTDSSTAWIEPEYPKLMSVKMYLRVIDRIEVVDPYEFYTEILTILNNNVSQDTLKIQIIERVLESLDSFQMRQKLSEEDFKCLIDHLAGECGQLLRKIDRCKLLLKISRFDCNEKYLEQVANLLNQLPASDNNEKFYLTCELLLNLTARRPLNSNEEKLYQWAMEVSSKDPEKELKFYSIKIKYDSIKAEIIGSSEHVEEGEEQSKTVDETFITHEFTANDHAPIEELTSEDLQKLKIFESFPNEI